jgi:ABC-type transporter Mla MlaB component
LKNSNNSHSVSFTGNLTVEHAAELKTVLIASLNLADRLCVVFDNVTEVDISFLQLLCSAHRTAVKNNKILWLDSQRPEPLRLAMQEAGFVRQEGCVLDVHQTCIWKEGWR